MKVEVYCRYSATDEPDKMGRWAREIDYSGLRIGWIDKLDNGKIIKYSVTSYFPIKRGDSPFLLEITNTYEDALILLKNEFKKFVEKISE